MFAGQDDTSASPPSAPATANTSGSLRSPDESRMEPGHNQQPVECSPDEERDTFASNLRLAASSSKAITSPPSSSTAPPAKSRHGMAQYLKRQASLAPSRRDSLNVNTPQFLTISPSFSPRSRSRSPSPFAPRTSRAAARHSIDVRSLPSYLARKRHSSKVLSNLVEVATSPFEPCSPLNEPQYEEPEAPILSLGERVAWVQAALAEFGTVKWIGRMPQVCATWTVGVEFDNAIGSGDGRMEGRRYFTSKENFAKFLPLSVLTKVDNYVGRPRSGTLLSRMSVQLKPGQLISVQRTPSISQILHCALNNPLHVDHDVHGINMDHCLCNNCNHPCAHLCKTTKSVKRKAPRLGKHGKAVDDSHHIAHLCHFSHKPHGDGKLCCGGDELFYEGAKSPKQSLALSNGSALLNGEKKRDNSLVSKARKESDSSRVRDRENSEPRSSRRSLASHRTGASRRTSSVPTSAERKHRRASSPRPLAPPDKRRGSNNNGSELSIASLPSTSSPVEVFIARGALTDESEAPESDDEECEPRAASEHVNGGPGSKGRSGGLRSLVSCLVPGISVSSSKKKQKHRRERFDCKRKKHFQPYTNSSCSSRSQSRSRSYHHRGLSTSPEPDACEPGQAKNNECSSKREKPTTNGFHEPDIADSLHVASASSSSPNLLSPVRDRDRFVATEAYLSYARTVSMQNTIDASSRSPIVTPLPPLLHHNSPASKSEKLIAELPAPPPASVSKSPQMLRAPSGESSASLGPSPSGSSRNSGRLVTTKADVEVTRSPSMHSSGSSLLTPGGRRKKCKAPAPPPLSPGSHNASPSSTSVTSPVTSPATSASLGIKRKSLKSRPAPTPPPLKALLTRSMSEQKQLNVKNLLNAAPSFRSEVDLKAASKKQQTTTQTLEGDALIISYEEISSVFDDEVHAANLANHVQVPSSAMQLVSLRRSLAADEDDAGRQARLLDACSEAAAMLVAFEALSEDDVEDDDDSDVSSTSEDEEDARDATEARLQFSAPLPPRPPLICKACGCCLFKGSGAPHARPLSSSLVTSDASHDAKPSLPKKTFSAVSTFGCDMKRPRRSFSLPLPKTTSAQPFHPSYAIDPNVEEESIYDKENIYEDIEFNQVSRDLAALLSPQHQQASSARQEHSSQEETAKDASGERALPAIQFITALTGFATQISLASSELASSAPSRRDTARARVEACHETFSSTHPRCATVSTYSGRQVPTQVSSNGNDSETTSSEGTLRQPSLPPPPLPCHHEPLFFHALNSRAPETLSHFSASRKKRADDKTRGACPTASTSNSSPALSSPVASASPASGATRTSAPSPPPSRRIPKKSHERCVVFSRPESQPATRQEDDSLAFPSPPPPLLLKTRQSSAALVGKPPIQTRNRTPCARSSKEPRCSARISANSGRGHLLLTSDRISASQPDCAQLSVEVQPEITRRPMSSEGKSGAASSREQSFVCALAPRSCQCCAHPCPTEQASIGRLMHQLETAIAHGQHRRAAVLARELALRKVTFSCTLNRSSQTATGGGPLQPIVVYLYVEDKASHEGPLPLQVYPTMSLRMLKLKVERDFGFPQRLQRWILGKSLATNEEASLTTYGVTSSGCPIFLYLLTPDEASVLSAAHGRLDEERAGAGAGQAGSEHAVATVGKDSADDASHALAEGLVEPEDASHSQAGAAKSDELDAGQETPKSELDVGTASRQAGYQSAEAVGGARETSSLRSDASPRELDSDVSNNITSGEYESAEECRDVYQARRGIMFDDEIAPLIDVDGKSSPKTYQMLVDLDDAETVANVEPFECPVCWTDVEAGAGVVLRDCLHVFCRDCLVNAVQYAEGAEVRCPFRNDEYSCDSRMQDREVKNVVPVELYERYLQRSMAAAESKAEKSFHCKSPDCPGWCEYEDNVNIFNCPVCGHENCVTCQAIHEDSNCRQYQDQLDLEASQNEDAKKTKELFDNMLAAGEATRCPQCKVIVMKKWGCDWIKCSMCQTEICWVTKGPRWGPNGRGDTSAGCKCMVNGQRCHPKCNYCH